ncbi:MAG: hypothetical protein GX837_11760 [Methanomicrobiales archaeon]|nr:hypothetical protein [Methanomicrobiales archaeon]
MGYATLSSEQVEKVKQHEKELGITLLAYQKPTYARLKDEDLKRIRDLEQDLGLSLVAYEV